MNVKLANELGILRADYENLRGYPFSLFYCPILYKDEDVELCKAHIINQAFPNTSRCAYLENQDGYNSQRYLTNDP